MSLVSCTYRKNVWNFTSKFQVLQNDKNIMQLLFLLYAVPRAAIYCEDWGRIRGSVSNNFFVLRQDIQLHCVLAMGETLHLLHWPLCGVAAKFAVRFVGSDRQRLLSDSLYPIIAQYWASKRISDMKTWPFIGGINATLPHFPNLGGHGPHPPESSPIPCTILYLYTCVLKIVQHDI